MHKPTAEQLPHLRARMDAAKQALLMDARTPCRGQIHSYQRGPRRYYKWQRCEEGTRTQRTVGVAAMEALVVGIADRAQFEQLVQDYYAACEALVLARAQAGTAQGEPGTAQKKKPWPGGKKMSGVRR